MKTRLSLAILCLAAGIVSATPLRAAGEACPTQPRPSPLDTVHPIDGSFVTRHISFAATPSLQFPSEAWVVRVYRTSMTDGEGKQSDTIEVFRLQLEYDCNRWFTTGLWDRKAEPGEMEEIRSQTRNFLDPLAQAYLDGTPATLGFSELALDGTGVALEDAGSYFRLRRGGSSSGEQGEPVSLAFHKLASTVVPAEDMPDSQWRRKR